MAKLPSRGFDQPFAPGCRGSFRPRRPGKRQPLRSGPRSPSCSLQWRRRLPEAAIGSTLDKGGRSGVLASLAHHRERALRFLGRDLVQRVCDMDERVVPGLTSSRSAVEISFLTGPSATTAVSASLSTDRTLAGRARHIVTLSNRPMKSDEAHGSTSSP
jgi:hypothetical protein